MGIGSSDVCVVGAGVIGLAVTACLRRRGVDVACLERSEPGAGQSAGRTRQFRHLHGDPALIDLAVRARKGWLQWQERSDATLLGSEGALRIGGEPGELEALNAAGVPAELLDAAQASERFPVAAGLDGTLLWDPLAGAIRAQDTIATLRDWIGGALRPAEVTSIAVDPGGGSVELRTATGSHRSACCVICAGAGTDHLVRPLGMEVHQERQAHLRLAFRSRSGGATSLPCFSDRRGEPHGYIYGLSDLGDRYAVGLAAPTTYPAVEDLAIDVPAGVVLEDERARIIDYVRRALPGLHPEPAGEVIRLTTTLPGAPEDGFEVWHEGPVIALAGPNLFKFAPVIGERLASAATEQPIGEVVSTRWR